MQNRRLKKKGESWNYMDLVEGWGRKVSVEVEGPFHNVSEDSVQCVQTADSVQCVQISKYKFYMSKGTAMQKSSA